MRFLSYILICIILFLSNSVFAVNKNEISEKDKNNIEEFSIIIENLIKGEEYSYASVLALDLITRYPNAPIGYFLLGRARQLSGYKNEAIKAYKDCLKANNTYYSANINIGVIRHDQKKYKEAIRQYNKVIKNSSLDKEKAIAYSNRAIAYYDIGKTKQALQDFEQIPNFDSQFLNSDKYFYTRGLYKFNLGDTEGAKLDYNQALKINPKLECDFYSKENICNY